MDPQRTHGEDAARGWVIRGSLSPLDLMGGPFAQKPLFNKTFSIGHHPGGRACNDHLPP
jgi:hypothetical protein